MCEQLIDHHLVKLRELVGRVWRKGVAWHQEEWRDACLWCQRQKGWLETASHTNKD